MSKYSAEIANLMLELMKEGHKMHVKRTLGTEK